jgi:hypothetical protein
LQALGFRNLEMVANESEQLYKMLFEWDTQTKTGKIDTTGVTYAKSGRGRGRGQNELDTGQYDSKQGLITIDGAAPMFRREALEAIKMPRPFLKKSGE